MNRLLFIFISSLVYFMVGSSHCNAEASSVRIISASVQIPFIPRRSYFVVSDSDQQVGIVQAEIMGAPFKRHSDENQTYIAAAGIRQASNSLTYSLVVEGDQGIVRSSTRTLNEATPREEPIEILQQYVSESGKENLELKSTLASLESELRRLRSDIDVIADIGRIVVLREERLRLEGLLMSIDQEERTLKESLSLVRAREVPGGYVAQEAQLMRVLSEYSQLLQKSKKKGVKKTVAQ